jgi:hypothetical protein
MSTFWPQELKDKWEEWKERRKAVKAKPFTEKNGLEEINMKRLDRFSNNDPVKAIRILQTAIDSGWKQFFEEKAPNNGQQPISQSNQQPPAGGNDRITALSNW